MEVVSLVENMVNVLQQLHDEYSALHDELSKHRGKELQDTDLPEVNRLLKQIQETFAKMHPILNFIAIRHQYVGNITNHYNEFIETIKKAGAAEREERLDQWLSVLYAMMHLHNREDRYVISVIESITNVMIK